MTGISIGLHRRDKSHLNVDRFARLHFMIERRLRSGVETGAALKDESIIGCPGTRTDIFYAPDLGEVYPRLELCVIGDG